MLVYLSRLLNHRGSATSFATSYPDDSPNRSMIGRYFKELEEKGLVLDTSDKKRGTYQLTKEGLKVAQQLIADNPDF